MWTMAVVVACRSAVLGPTLDGAAAEESPLRGHPPTPTAEIRAIDAGTLGRCVSVEPLRTVEMEGLTALRAKLLLSRPLLECGCVSGRIRYEVYEGCAASPFCEMRAASSVAAPRLGEQVVEFGLASGGPIESPALRLECWREDVLPAQDALPPPTPPGTSSPEDEILARRNSSAIDAARWLDPQASARARESGLAALRVKRSRVANCVDCGVGLVETWGNLTTLELEITRLGSQCPCLGDWLGYSVYERAPDKRTAKSPPPGMIEASWGTLPLPQRFEGRRRVRIVLSADQGRRYGPLLLELGCP
jgi:hypothetical protein